MSLVEVEIHGLQKPVSLCCHDGAAAPVLQGVAGGAGDRTGVLLWAGCRALCAYIVACGSPSATVVELGTGAGLAGAVAALRFPGAAVTVTDGAPEALALCERTLAANGLAGRVAVAQWSWDDPAAHVDGGAGAVAAAAAGSVDLLLGAEIVYPSTTLGSLRNLFALARRVLRRPLRPSTTEGHDGDGGDGGVFAMAYVPRRPETTLAMLYAAWGAGLRWRLVPAREYWPSAVSEPPPLGVVVLEFRHAAALAAGALDGSKGNHNSYAGYCDPALRADVDALLAEAQQQPEAAHGGTSGEDPADAPAATFAGAVHAAFPDAVPAILAERALRSEIEDDYQQALSQLGGALSDVDKGEGGAST